MTDYFDQSHRRDHPPVALPDSDIYFDLDQHSDSDSISTIADEDDRVRRSSVSSVIQDDIPIIVCPSNVLTIAISAGDTSQDANPTATFQQSRCTLLVVSQAESARDETGSVDCYSQLLCFRSIHL